MRSLLWLLATAVLFFPGILHAQGGAVSRSDCAAEAQAAAAAPNQDSSARQAIDTELDKNAAWVSEMSIEDAQQNVVRWQSLVDYKKQSGRSFAIETDIYIVCLLRARIRLGGTPKPNSAGTPRPDIASAAQSEAEEKARADAQATADAEARANAQARAQAEERAKAEEARVRAELANTTTGGDGFIYDDMDHRKCVSVRGYVPQGGASELAYGRYDLINSCSYGVNLLKCINSDRADGTPAPDYDAHVDGAECPGGGLYGTELAAGETKTDRTWFEYSNLKWYIYVCRVGWNIVGAGGQYPSGIIGEKFRCRKQAA